MLVSRVPRRGRRLIRKVGKSHENPRSHRLEGRQTTRSRRRWIWTGRRPAKCWSRSRRPASATPMNSRARARDPEGLFPVIFGHEGAGIVVDVGPGVTTLKKGDHVIPLYTPECRQCKSCLSRKTNLCTAIRATQGKGVMPDGTSRFSIGNEKVHHYMGCSHVLELHRAARDRAREDPRGRAVREGLLHRLRRHHRHRRGHQHREGRAGRECRGVRPRRHRPQRHPGRAHGGRQQDHRRRHQSASARRWPRSSA